MTDETDKTYRTRLLEFLCYEQKQLEQERQRIDGRLFEIRQHIDALVRAKNEQPELRIERRFARRDRRRGG